MEGHELSHTFLSVPRSLGESAHQILDAAGRLHADILPVELDKGRIGFPMNDQGEQNQQLLIHLKEQLGESFELIQCVPTFQFPNDPHQRLAQAVTTWLGDDASLATLQLPTKWERLGDLVLFPHGSFSDESWQKVRITDSIDELWRGIAQALKVSSIGLQAPIAKNTLRTPQIEMLRGSSDVEFLDHGIRYGFDASRVMFSSGNITERRRIAGLEMNEEIVIDAYAGIGYYTFPMLIHAGAKHVHACELNPSSIEGLKWGINANGLESRVTVHEGDNSTTMPTLRGQADRCHLGLLPSSELAWGDALLCLKSSGGWLHIHMNVEEEKIGAWMTKTLTELQSICDKNKLHFTVEGGHLERVKWYAPHVRHVVFDVRCKPI